MKFFALKSKLNIVLPALLTILAVILWLDTHPRKYVSTVPLAPPPPPLYAKAAPHGASNVRFADVAASAGLAYQWHIDGPRPCDILQTIGNGCAFLDYDNDGDIDILLIGPELALYKGNGHGKFIDVTHAVGLDRLRGHFLGCCVGDVDNDGFDDVYVSAYRGGLLLRNVGGKEFTDATPQSGIASQPWGTSCAFADIDGDGRLDLYVGNYAKFDKDRSERLCMVNGINTSCGPVKYWGQAGVLYRGVGGMMFANASKGWGLNDWGKNLGVAFADYDDSGRQSLYLANDEMPGELFHNCGRKFKNMGRESGTAYDAYGAIHAGMGIDWGDFDNDGKPDLFAAAFRKEPKCIYRNLGAGVFEEQGKPLGIDEWSVAYVAFGGKWLDVDNDGWLDLMIANGHVQDNIHDIEPAAMYEEPTQLFHNRLGRKFANISTMTGTDLQRPIVGRGLATGDFDNDGRVDALVVNAEGSPLLLHNTSKATGNFLTLTLEGAKSNRDGYGAKVTVVAGGVLHTRYCHSDGSYLSASDKRVHVGLGSAKTADRVEIRWPSGHVDTYRHIAVNRFWTALEGAQELAEIAP